jgi:pimeloyl-ACP methyl ester carboxylesterase
MTESNMEALRNDGVVILHGIFRTHRSMAGLARHIKKQGYQILNVGYPSTSMTLEDITQHIHPRIEEFTRSIKGNVHFVGFSMGGLVIRSYLHHFKIPNLKRVVMIGTPNQGSEVADFVKHWRLYKRLYGPAGQQLVTGSTILEDKVHYELGIIAGNFSRATPVGAHIIGKESDGTVSVESTKLEGMKEHIVLPVPHSLFPMSRRAWRLTTRFLEFGQFGNS